MAKKVSIELIDDLDGSVIETGKGGTIAFSVDGASYEIDLTDASRSRLDDALAPFVAAARRVGAGGSASRRRSSTRTGSRDELQAIRTWARANGHKVSDRGRISAEVREAYAAAH